jgi:6-phospho-beta-glucosidase
MTLTPGGAPRPATRAAISGDRRVALRALLAHPLVPDYRTARGLLDAILESNRAQLPRLFPA